MKQITIIGAGELGTALGEVLKPENRVFWHDKNKKLALEQPALDEILPASDIVFLCVPSPALAGVINEIKKTISKNALVVSLTKGMEPDGKTPFDLLTENFSTNRFGLLSGPMLAEELVSNRAVGVFASKSQFSFHRLTLAFSGTGIRLEHSFDLTGVEACSILKNIYAIGFGIAESLGWGMNIRSWLLSQVLGEMVLAVDALGGRHATVFGPAGVGDLLATGFSECSLNHRVGKELGSLGSTNMESEGLSSIAPMWRKLRALQKKLPVLSLLHEVIAGKQRPELVFTRFVKSFPKM
ncbi:MAG: NAD(P)-binding domain-containing protein [Acidobacteriaceae bacterium]